MKFILNAIRALFRGLDSKMAEIQKSADAAVEEAKSAKVVYYVDFNEDKDENLTLVKPDKLDSIVEAIKENKSVIARVQEYTPVPSGDMRTFYPLSDYQNNGTGFLSFSFFKLQLNGETPYCEGIGLTEFDGEFIIDRVNSLLN